MFCIPSRVRSLNLARARARAQDLCAPIVFLFMLTFFSSCFTYKHRDGVMNTEIKERKMTQRAQKVVLGELANPEELESTKKRPREDHREEHATHGQRIE